MVVVLLVHAIESDRMFRGELVSATVPSEVPSLAPRWMAIEWLNWVDASVVRLAQK